MNSKPAMTASVGFRSRHTRAGEFPTTSGVRDLSRDDSRPRRYRMRRLRSEDSATRKTEGGRVELFRSHAHPPDAAAHRGALVHGKWAQEGLRCFTGRLTKAQPAD